MALAATQISERKRVKVYELRENDWYDRGTGFCAAQTISDEARILVESEEVAGEELLEVRIRKDDNYQKQQETLIVWTDQEGVDMALSFQEAEGCGVVWTTIGEVQQRIPEGIDDNLSHPLTLPPAELGRLGDIEALVRGVIASHSQQSRDTLSRMVLNENYIASLIPLLEMAEDLEDLDDLHRLCNVMKSFILLNDTQIMEYVVRDDIILGVVGALEYDPDFPHHKANHRQYLSDASKYKEVVRIQDDEIRRKIHFTYRLQYLKDVVLARVLDDPTFTVLNSLIYFQQVDIVQHIQGNAPFLRELFSIINTSDASAQKKKDAVLFLQQSCAIAKNLPASSRIALFQNLDACGLFSAISFSLQQHDASVRVAGTDILVAVIEHDASLMRNHIFKSINDGTKPMTDTLIELLLVETDLGVKAQLADALKVLLDHNSGGPAPDRTLSGEPGYLMKMRDNAANASQTDSFLQHFYENSANKLFRPLKELESTEAARNLTAHQVSLFAHLVEILCFLLRQYMHRSKFYILSEGLASRVALLMACPEKHLKLASVKYFRTCIGIKDEFHNRQIVHNRLFEPLINVIYESMPRDGLLNSACLELFDFIRKESIKPLVIHLAETYRERFQAITYVDIFQGILLRYDQIMNPAAHPPPSQLNGAADLDSSFMTSDADTPSTRRITITGGGPRWQGLKDPDADEDAYFNASDGEDDEDDDLMPGTALTNGASPLSKPLVDYVDEDDDDEDAIPTEQKPDLPTDSSTPSPEAAKATLQSEPESITTSSPPTSGAHSAVPSTPPLSIAEKRRREEDEDDDELGKLSANVAKRRNSAQAASIHLSSGGGGGIDSDASPSPVSEAEKTGLRPRRKRAAVEAVKGKKMSIGVSGPAPSASPPLAKEGDDGDDDDDDDDDPGGGAGMA